MAENGRTVIDWPADTFAEESPVGLPIASAAALDRYRRDHARVARAYAALRAR